MDDRFLMNKKKTIDLLAVCSAIMVMDRKRRTPDITEILAGEKGIINVLLSGNKVYSDVLDVSGMHFPWKIDIRYYIDGKEYDAYEIAGMSGLLKIVIDIDKNTDSDTFFRKNYALWVKILLDTAICRNIAADGAVITDAGTDKYLSCIVMPQKRHTIRIMADVRDFEMKPVEINGIKSRLDADSAIFAMKTPDIRIPGMYKKRLYKDERSERSENKGISVFRKLLKFRRK